LLCLSQSLKAIFAFSNTCLDKIIISAVDKDINPSKYCVFLRYSQTCLFSKFLYESFFWWWQMSATRHVGHVQMSAMAHISMIWFNVLVWWPLQRMRYILMDVPESKCPWFVILYLCTQSTFYICIKSLVISLLINGCHERDDYQWGFNYLSLSVLIHPERDYVISSTLGVITI
jgi:hypothetical protein